MATAEKVPVILFFENPAPEIVSTKLRNAGKAGDPDPQPAVVAKKEIEDRRDLLSKMASRAQISGLDAPRMNIAGNAVFGRCEEADLPGIAKSLGAADWMVDVVLDPQMNVSIPTMLPEAFHNAGFYGQASAFDVGILDAGIDGSHPAFAGVDLRYHIDHTNALSDANYNDSSTNPDDLSNAGHGTHIAGIILGRAAPTWESYLGVAPQTSRLYNLKSGFRRSDRTTSGLYFSDALDNIDWGIFQASDDIDLLNFSWGTTATADDSGLARFFDAVVADLGVPVVIAAGNGGPTVASLVDPATAYNAITVGATNDAGTTNRSDDNVTGSSSRGPTIGGRKKPDLVAPGFLIQSPTNFWETGLDYSNVSGTSFAAPHVVGAAQLVMDYFGPSVHPLQVKALLIGSASPGSFFESGASVEWDSKWGWGYVNLDRAYDYRQSVFLHSVNPAGQTGDYKLYRGNMSPVSRAALVWNRHVNYVTGGGQPSTAGTLNDLNLRVYDHEVGTLLDSSTSGIDNVEVVSITLRDYETVIKVSAADSSFSRVSSETYGLSTPPEFVFPNTLPRPAATAYVTNENPRRLIAFLGNTGDFNAHSTSTSLTLPAGVDIAAGLKSTTQGTLLRNSPTQRTVVTTLLSGDTITGSGSMAMSSDSYGETYSSSNTIGFTGLPTGLIVTFQTPVGLAAGEATPLMATITNNSGSMALNSSITLVRSTDLQILSGAETAILGSLEPGAGTTAQWTVAIQEAGLTVHALGAASAATAGGGTLGGRGIVTLATLDEVPELTFEVSPVGETENVPTGSGLELKALASNTGETDLNSMFVSLGIPSGFVLASGSTRQSIGTLTAGATVEVGRWLLITPQTAQTAEFSLTLDNNMGLETTTRFYVSVARSHPPHPSAFSYVLQDAPLIQDWTGSSDNDPAGLCILSDGSSVFFNGQSGSAPGHDAIVRFNPIESGTSALSVLATRKSIRGVLGTNESFTIDGLAADDNDTVYALVRVTRSSGKDPRHLVAIPALGKGDFGAPRSVVPPGLPPYGILFNDDLEETGICWDSQRGRLLVLVDNGSTSDDTAGNGIYAVEPQTGSMEILFTYSQLAQGLTPQPVAGSDPIGFSGMAIDAEGSIFLMNTGGLGGNRGDVIRVPTSGVPELLLDDSALLQRLPANYADFPVRLLPFQPQGKLGVLVCDRIGEASSGEAILTDWNYDGSFAEIRATRSQLLTGTGAGYLTCPSGGALVDGAGNYRIWSTRDNETLLLVRNPDAPVGELFTIY